MKRKALLVLIDSAILLTVYAAFVAIAAIMGGLNLPWWGYALNFLATLALTVSSRILWSVYFNIYRYANSSLYLLLIESDVVGGLATWLLTYAISLSGLPVYLGFWQTVSVVTLFDIATLGSRFVYQQMYRRRNATKSVDSSKISVAIVGAGQIGVLLAEELIYNVNSHYKPVCFIDTDPSKAGTRIEGLPVFSENGAISEIKNLQVQEIFIAIPKIDSDRAREIYDYYSVSGCKVKLYDFPIKAGIESAEEEIIDESSRRRVLKEISIEDLLFRDSIKINGAATREFYYGKVVLVTGGGGSIGSEICRQVAKCKPKKLVIFDIYENNAYEIEQALKNQYGDKLDLSVEIGSVRDRDRLDAVFAYYKPQIVFHAAAHKHVPLMEHSNCEAVKNNVFGTYNTADIAEKYGVDKFVLISTDKAVNPTNVMGASKRLCEMAIQCRTGSKTTFAAVRFGNVLGSNGSVIPLFKSQIEKGGPVTVTDKRIIRYFMTIPEASQLVMQAGAMAEEGELFVLDMGKPVKIIDLAENMIRLSGYKPYVDIDIKEIGLRPGEKLYEELLIKTENLTKTKNSKIFIERDTPLTRGEFDGKIAELKLVLEKEKTSIASPEITAVMKRLVPTFRNPDEVNRIAAASDEMKAVDKPKNKVVISGETENGAAIMASANVQPPRVNQ